MRAKFAIFGLFFLFLGLTSAPAGASGLLLSTDTNASLGGLDFENGDLVEFQPLSELGQLVFDESAFSDNEQLDGVQLLADGSIILSTGGSATLAGLSFSDGDIVKYNRLTDTATLLFSEGDFSGNEDVEAVHVLSDGRIVLSTESNATLGGISFTRADLVVYDATTGVAEKLIDGSSVFRSGDNESIDAVTMLGSGRVLLSTTGSARIGSLHFRDEDVIEYDMNTGLASMHFDGSTHFNSNEDVDGFTLPAPAVPEPSSLLLIGIGLIGMATIRRMRGRKEQS